MSNLLHVGSNEPEVGNLQRFLSGLGYLNEQGEVLKVDEDFGGDTEHALKSYQEAQSLPPCGTFDEATRQQAVQDGFIPFITAKNFTPNGPTRQVDVIVIHTMEAPDKGDTAHRVALYFANQPAQNSLVNGVPFKGGSSAHYCIDAGSTVQCVRERHIAWHAPGANRNGIGLEHAGFARETALEWESDYNKQMLARSAKLAARLCKFYDVPAVKLTVDDLRSGVRGICGHVDVTNAFSKGIGHTDPGLFFPYEEYVELVKNELNKLE
jgi:N-acetyl-anhydromuramyl-L-alanine amidase AmpD